MMNASDWWEVRRLAQAGVSQREIAVRLGINRRTVAKLAANEEPPSEEPTLRGSQLDPLMPAMDEVLAEQPGMTAPRMTDLLRAEQGYGGSVDLVRRRLAEVRSAGESTARPAGPRPGQVAEWDWTQMRERPCLGGMQRNAWALVAWLPFSGAQTAHFSLDATLESFLEGHVRVFEWLRGVPAVGVYDHLLPTVAKRDSRGAMRWNKRFRALRGCYAFESTAREPMDVGAPVPENSRKAASDPRGGVTGSLESAVERLRADFWPTHRFKNLAELDVAYASWRDAQARGEGSGDRPIVERLAEERKALRPLPSEGFDFSVRRTARVSPDGYVLYGACFYGVPSDLANARVELHAGRDRVWVEWRGKRVVTYARSYTPGVWLPGPPL